MPPIESNAEHADKRAQLLARVKAGEKTASVAKELGVNENTAHVWVGRDRKKERAPEPPEDVVETSEIPIPIKVETKEGKKERETKRGKKGSRPLSEDSVERLVRLPFIAAALFANEPIWLLSDMEAKELAGPGADSLAMLPNPIADAINTYAAPGEFVAVLIAIVGAKRNAINRRKQGMPAQPVAQRSTVATSAVNTPENKPTAQPETNQDADLAAAVAAAKGGLQDLDEQPSGEGLLQ